MKNKLLLAVALFAFLAVGAFSADYQKVKKYINEDNLFANITVYSASPTIDANKAAEYECETLFNAVGKNGLKGIRLTETVVYLSNGEGYAIQLGEDRRTKWVIVRDLYAEFLFEKNYTSFNAARADYDRQVAKYLKMLE